VAILLQCSVPTHLAYSENDVYLWQVYGMRGLV